MLQVILLHDFIVAVFVVDVKDCVVPGVITHTKSTSNAMTNGPELEKAEPSRRVSGGPCTMKAQDIL